MKSQLPREQPIDRLGIENLKTIDDIKRWLSSYIRELDIQYAKFKDDRENQGFSHEDFRSNQENGDLLIQVRTVSGTIETWTTVWTFKGS